MRGPSKMKVSEIEVHTKKIKNQSKNYPIDIKILMYFWIDFWNDLWLIFDRFLIDFGTKVGTQNRPKRDKNRGQNGSKI